MTLTFFCSPVTLTHFTLTCDSSLNIKPTTTKPCMVLLLNALTKQVLWPGDLDLHFAMQWLWHVTSTLGISLTKRPKANKPCAVLLDVLTLQVPWSDDLDLYFMLHWLTRFTLTFDISSTIKPTSTKPCIVLLHDVMTWLCLDLVTLTYIARSSDLNILRPHSIIIGLYNTNKSVLEE